MNDLVTWAALLAGASALIALLRFWTTYSDRLTKAEAKAATATEIAQEAKKDAFDATEKLAVLTAAFSLYREQVAREYIHREVMREVEDRLTAAIDRLGMRVDRFTEAAIHK